MALAIMDSHDHLSSMQVEAIACPIPARRDKVKTKQALRQKLGRETINAGLSFRILIPQVQMHRLL
jgi:hypothetical protein